MPRTNQIIEITTFERIAGIWGAFERLERKTWIPAKDEFYCIHPDGKVEFSSKHAGKWAPIRTYAGKITAGSVELEVSTGQLRSMQLELDQDKEVLVIQPANASWITWRCQKVKEYDVKELKTREGQCTVDGKIYLWAFYVNEEKIVVSYQNKKLFDIPCNFREQRQMANSDYIKPLLEKWLKNPPKQGYHVVYD